MTSPLSSATGLGIVAAMARNGVIGRGGGLPWRIPEDLRRFRAITEGHAVVMGRKTFDSIGRALPKRRNIVVSQNPSLQIPGCEVASSFEQALARAQETDALPMVIGGASVYAQALPIATVLYLTEIDRVEEGDTFFPPFDRSAFRAVRSELAETPGVRFVVLERVASEAA